MLRDAGDPRASLLEEIAGADRLVLLGDVVELRDLPLGAALDAARPFFEELGEAMGEREVTLVPGNHDHRLAEPLLERARARRRRRARARAPRRAPATAPAPRSPPGSAPAELRIAYPGVWLRDDVYATHGHYMDCPPDACRGPSASPRRR